MDTITKQEYSFPKCNIHNQDVCCVCVNSQCKGRILCYECVFSDHNKHVSECIPLNLWRIENSSILNIDSHIDKISAASIDLKDMGDIIQSYFVKVIERLYSLQEDLLKNNLDLPNILRNMSICNNYIVKDGLHIIKSENISNMIDNLSLSSIMEIQTYIEETIQKFKKNKCFSNELKKSNIRFNNLKDNWSHTISYWDCLGFQVKEDIYLLGFGVYKPDNLNTEFIVNFKLFEADLKDEKCIFEKEYEISKIVYENNCYGDLLLGRDLQILKGKTYILALFNQKANCSSKYGKETANINHDPITFISYKGTSDSYKNGNYTDLTCGMFPYLIYK